MIDVRFTPIYLRQICTANKYVSYAAREKNAKSGNRVKHLAAVMTMATGHDLATTTAYHG